MRWEAASGATCVTVVPACPPPYHPTTLPSRYNDEIIDVCYLPVPLKTKGATNSTLPTRIAVATNSEQVRRCCHNKSPFHARTPLTCRHAPSLALVHSCACLTWMALGPRPSSATRLWCWAWRAHQTAASSPLHRRIVRSGACHYIPRHAAARHRVVLGSRLTLCLRVHDARACLQGVACGRCHVCGGV